MTDRNPFAQRIVNAVSAEIGETFRPGIDQEAAMRGLDATSPVNDIIAHIPMQLSNLANRAADAYPELDPEEVPLAALAHKLLLDRATNGFASRTANPRTFFNMIDPDHIYRIGFAEGRQAERAEAPDALVTYNIVDAAYAEVFGREVDPEGFAFYASLLDSGQITQAALLADLRKNKAAGAT